VPIEQVHSEEELTPALEQPRAVLYKHSPRCGISHRSLREVERFAEQVPDVPVYMVDVVSNRDLSDAIAERFEIRHQSPQAIVLENGQPTWHASHFQISARRLEKEVGSKS
jgi:bacillithiol system protein YtxJ